MPGHVQHATGCSASSWVVLGVRWWICQVCGSSSLISCALHLHLSLSPCFSFTQCSLEFPPADDYSKSQLASRRVVDCTPRPRPHFSGLVWTLHSRRLIAAAKQAATSTVSNNTNNKIALNTTTATTTTATTGKKVHNFYLYFLLTVYGSSRNQLHSWPAATASTTLRGCDLRERDGEKP